MSRKSEDAPGAPEGAGREKRFSHEPEGIRHPLAGIPATASDTKSQTVSSSDMAQDSRKGRQLAETPLVGLRICQLDSARAVPPHVVKQLADAEVRMDSFAAGDAAFSSIMTKPYDVFVVVQPPGETDGSTASLVELMMTSERLASGALPLIVLTDNGSTANVQSFYAAGARTVVVGLNSAQLQDVLQRLAKGMSEIPVLQPVSKPLAVCLFDDSYAFGQHVKAHLNARGHRVDYFPSAEAARAAALKKHYDVIVAGQSDAGGLEVSGFVLALRNSGDAHCRKVPIFVLADSASAATASTFTAAGVNAVLQKRISNAFNKRIVQAVESVRSPKSFSPVAANAQPVRRKPAAKRAAPPAKTPPPKLELSFGGSDPQPGGPVQSGRKAPIPNSVPPIEMIPRRRAARVSPRAFSQPAPAAVEPKPARSKFAVTVVALGLIAAVVVSSWHHLFEEVPVDVVGVRQGMLSKTVVGDGRVEAKKQLDLTSAQPGLIAKVNVSEGDRVKRGATLARLDDREAKANLSRAQAKLEQATSDLRLKQHMLDQLRETSKSGGIAASIIDELAGDITAAKARRNLAEQELAAAGVALEKLDVTAPFDGVIMQSYALEGGWSEPPGALFKLVDLNQFEVVIRVDPSEARGVNVGDTVRYASEAFSGKEWEGSVRRIVPLEQTRGRNVIVHAELGGKAPKLRYGQAVDAQIVIESAKDAIKVPFEAVFDYNGQQMAAVVENGKAQFKSVEVGIQALAEIQVLSGLSIEQEVILRPGELRDGQPVSPRRIASDSDMEAAGYPFREKYSQVAVYSTDDLRREYDNAVIVDVRSKLEYDVVHIAKALNVPLSGENFESLLSAVRSKTNDEPIVFYCNGHTCTKSYKAALLAKKAGFKNVFAYDSGVFDWLNGNRDRTMLLGMTPAPLEKMVSDDYFQSRLIDFDAFKKRADNDKSVVLDVRDELQRKTALTIPTTQVPMDALIVKLGNGEYKGQQLLIADAVGKQVRWLQYLLENLGYKDYYFLRGGVDGVTG